MTEDQMIAYLARKGYIIQHSNGELDIATIRDIAYNDFGYEWDEYTKRFSL